MGTDAEKHLDSHRRKRGTDAEKHLDPLLQLMGGCILSRFFSAGGQGTVALAVERTTSSHKAAFY